MVVLDVLSQDPEGMRFLLGIGTKEVEVRLPLVGEHNAVNAAAAAAPRSRSAAATAEIVRGLAGVRPVGRRLRLERLPSGVLLVDDCYNANPASMKAALRTLRQLAGAGRAAGRARRHARARARRGRAAPGAGAGRGRRRARRPRHLRAARPPGPPRPRSRPAWTRPTPSTPRIPWPLVAFVRERLRPGDVLLVKGSRGMKLERLVEALR